MNFNKFTIKAQEAVQTAQEIAISYNNQAVETIHLLAALIQDSAGLIPDIIQRIGANLPAVMIQVNEGMNKLPKVNGTGATNQFLSNSLGELFNKAVSEAAAMKDEYVSTEHLFIVMSDPKSDVYDILIKQGITKDNILKALKNIRGNSKVSDQNPEEKYQALKKYGRNLTDMASAGKLDPVIGREEEIRRVLQVLSRRTKNNPVLIGEPGVG
ncbi:MAG: Clp protease N-terminal domain-containing protein, partial [Candidatus Kapabacteria bacterium]|nr:Clp protease N-terminal domain-containing protein [Candidatus Kapabacteria bacterium]